MNLYRLLFCILVLLTSLSSFANPSCRKTLKGESFYLPKEDSSEPEITASFIGYLGSLFESGDLHVDSLVQLKTQLESGSSDISIFSGSASLVSIVHRDSLLAYLKESNFDKPLVLAWITETLNKASSQAKQRNAVEEEAKHLDRSIVFSPIKRGSYATTYEASPFKFLIRTLVNISRNVSSSTSINSFPFEVELLQDFEVMETPVTHGQWLEIMGEHPDTSDVEFSGSDLGDKGGTNLGLMPGYPVTNMTWWAALIFANKLSEKHGYKPVYDLSKLRERYSDDNRSISQVYFSEGELGIDAPGGDIYKAEGYRLPTHAEYQYMLSKLSMSEYDLMISYGEFYRSTSKTLGFGVRPVDYEEPVQFYGSPLYDLAGNVRVWTFDNEKGIYTHGKRVLGGSFQGRVPLSLEAQMKSPENLDILMGVHQNPWVHERVNFDRDVDKVDVEVNFPKVVVNGISAKNTAVTASEKRVTMEKSGVIGAQESRDLLGIRLVRSLPDGEFERRQKNREGER